MSGHKVLIDTNVIIELEDHKEVSPIFARFLQLCAQHGVRVFVHERALADVERDKKCGPQSDHAQQNKEIRVTKRDKTSSARRLDRAVWGDEQAKRRG